MNILVIGHRQHGKTHVGELLAKILNTQAHDSSWYACENIIYPALKDKYGYASAQDAHNDRGAHRQEWFELIEAYNDQPDRLTKAILSEGTIYIGMRSRMEFEGSKHHFDHVIWVDASQRLPEEDSTSMKLTRYDADYVLDNNGSLDALPAQMGLLMEWLTYQIPKEDTSVRVFDIDPRLYLARGLLSGFVMNMLLPKETPRLNDDLVVETFGDLSVAYPDGTSIVAGNLTAVEYSFDDLQKRVRDWANARFPDATHATRFNHLESELNEILAAPGDVTEWADALMILIHGMAEEGFSMQNDVLPAAYSKLEELHKRQYYYDDAGRLRWTLDE